MTEAEYIRLKMADKNQRSTYLERLAKLDEVSHPLVHLILDQRLFLFHEPILLVRDKVPECREGISRRLDLRREHTIHKTTTSRGLNLP
jgi:hypothetical protein